MKKMIIFSLTVFSVFLLQGNIMIPDIQGHDTVPTGTGIDQAVSHTTQHPVEEVSEESHGEGHGSDMSPLLFIITALAIGAATRHFLKKSSIPFTAILLIVGLVLGASLRLGWLDHLSESFGVIERSIYWAGHIDPHLILYIFLPTLIFEAAFAMNFHTFKKTAVNVVLLAVPGIIIAMLLTGLLVMNLDKFGLAMDGWGWAMALMFGAVASATDPVAVVALLKDLGASKKLGTLIEGESMLNDGTAIVLFMVFFLGITGQATGTHPVIEFLRVSVGGIAVGLVIGSLSIAWVRKVFNDALVEISVIVAAAYITFYLCEYFLHVSGVLGLVTLGLAMASVGKTRISPEVEHFLQEFWELAAFIANTLIFIIVGVVIAEQVTITGKNLLILGIVYVGVHIIRALVILIFYPFMRKAGYGLPKKDAVVVWYGALRGAVGLALALMVAGESRIPPEIRNDFLFLIAGLVTLTLLINATTIGYLVKYLGLTRLSPTKQIMQTDAHRYLFSSSQNSLEKAKRNKALRRANWEVVKEYLYPPVKDQQIYTVKIDTIAEYRSRILEKEKSSYWHQFKNGLLGPNAVIRLTMTIENIIDQGGMVPLSERPDLEESWKTKGWMVYIRKIPFLSKISHRYFFERLSVGYDSARAFVEAQEDALKLVESMVRGIEADGVGNYDENIKILEIVEEEIKENIIQGQTFIRNLRKSYPEIYSAISTRLAIRTLLNYEKYTVERLLKNGRLENSEAQKLISDIEERMKKLLNAPLQAKMPDTLSMLKESSLFRNLDPGILQEVIPLMQTRVFPAKEIIIRENSRDTGLCFIARGTVRITVRGRVLDVLHRGDFIGEIAELTGVKRSAEVIAESPVTVFWLLNTHLKNIVSKYPVITERLWQIGGERISKNLLNETPPFSAWAYEKIKNLAQKGKLLHPEEVSQTSFPDKIIILVSGKATERKDKSHFHDAPVILAAGDYIYSDDALLFVC